MLGCMLAIWRERRSGFAHVGDQSLEPSVSRAVLCRETSVWEDVCLAKGCRSISRRKGSSDVAMCALGRGRSRKAEEDSSPDALRRPFGDPILSTSAHSADSLRSPRRRQKKTWLAFMFAARVRATRLYGRGTRFGFSTSPAKLHCFKMVRRPESRIDGRLERGWVCIPDTLFTSSQLAQHDTL